MAFERQPSINRAVGFHNISKSGKGYNQSSKLQQKHAVRAQKIQSPNNLKGSDDGILHFGLLGFWPLTLSHIKIRA